MGVPGSTTRLHYDNQQTHAWLAQVEGTKQFVLSVRRAGRRSDESAKSPRRRIAAAPRPRRGYSEETHRGRDAAILRRRIAAAPRLF